MSRSGYHDDHEQWQLIRWRGAVKSALRGRRGQAALREILSALDALPNKRLAADSLQNEKGEFCTLGALGRARGLDMSELDPEDMETVAGTLGVADAMAREIVYQNDDANSPLESPERRFSRMRAWVAGLIAHTEDQRAT